MLETEREAKQLISSVDNAVALVKFTHAPYAHPGRKTKQIAVDLILEEVSKKLGIPYAVE
jgi:predicted TIM-barrel enzyme